MNLCFECCLVAESEGLPNPLLWLPVTSYIKSYKIDQSVYNFSKALEDKFSIHFQLNGIFCLVFQSISFRKLSK